MKTMCELHLMLWERNKLELFFNSGEFAGLHDKMKSNMASELEIIVQGDK